jgi:hypothetical protein
MNYQEHIENTEMGIDFTELESKSKDELSLLIEKYKCTIHSYKKEKYSNQEIFKVFGDKPFIYTNENKTILDLRLMALYRKQLKHNYSHVLEMLELKRQQEKIDKKEKTKEKKRKADKQYYEEHREKMIAQIMAKYHEKKEIMKEKIVCDICNGCYTFTNKSNHLRTAKHKNCLPQETSA